MDTRTAKEIVEDKLFIKTHMPETYKSIQAKAEQIGGNAWALVTRSLRGEPNCFWAMERGYIKGTLFNLANIQSDVAWSMVAFGTTCACIWPLVQSQPQGDANGTH